MTPKARQYLLRFLGHTPLLRRFSKEEDARITSSCALFYGDIPPTHRSPAIGTVINDRTVDGVRRNFVGAESFRIPRPIKEEVEDVLYTAEGFAWNRGRLDERYSVRHLSAMDPGAIRSVLRRPSRRSARRLPRATIIESEHPHTYGDWVSEQVKSIALVGEFPPPLILPEFLARRPYVQHELRRLGVEFMSPDVDVLIEKACVLRKPTPRTFWSGEEVAAYRALFGIDPPRPGKGSLIYLSRSGVESEQSKATRVYRSAAVADAVRSLGGRVVETSSMKMDDFARLAGEAETVVADHGAAIFNIMQWRPQNLIEIVAENWWSPCFVFLGAACGVANHALVRCDDISDDALKARVREHVETFRRRTPERPEGFERSGGGR